MGVVSGAANEFTAKLKVLGEEPAKIFAGQYKAGNGQMQPCYHLPKREAHLMVMIGLVVPLRL